MPIQLQDMIENIDKNKKYERLDTFSDFKENSSPSTKDRETTDLSKSNVTNLPINENVLRLEPIDSPDKLRSVTFRLNEAEVDAQLLSESQSLKFGIFPEDIVEKILSKDWKIRSVGSEYMLAHLEKLHKLDALIPYIDEFTKILLGLLNDINFKICVNSLNITGLVLKMTTEEVMRPFYSKFVDSLIQKLGDGKIAIRQIASKILSVNAKKIGFEAYLLLLFPHLENANWHLREEILILICSLFTSHSKKLGPDVPNKACETIL